MSRLILPFQHLILSSIDNLLSRFSEQRGSSSLYHCNGFQSPQNLRNRGKRGKNASLLQKRGVDPGQQGQRCRPGGLMLMLVLILVFMLMVMLMVGVDVNVGVV